MERSRMSAELVVNICPYNPVIVLLYWLRVDEKISGLITSFDRA